MLELWLLIALIILVAVIYKPVTRVIFGALDGHAAKVRAELDQAKRLREEAQSLLASHQRQLLGGEDRRTRREAPGPRLVRRRAHHHPPGGGPAQGDVAQLPGHVQRYARHPVHGKCPRREDCCMCRDSCETPTRVASGCFCTGSAVLLRGPAARQGATARSGWR